MYLIPIKVNRYTQIEQQIPKRLAAAYIKMLKTHTAHTWYIGIRITNANIFSINSVCIRVGMV